MARAASVAIGGYYPFPPELLAALAALVRCDARPGARHAIADPCAGDGAAILDLARAWFPAPAQPTTRIAAVSGPIVAVAEAEETRGASPPGDPGSPSAPGGDRHRLCPGGRLRPGPGG
jgi:hypothetical protein